MTAELSIPALAGQAYEAFTTLQRGEETITVLRDDRPDWVQALVQSAHGDLFPDDWRYATIASALECIADSDDPEDAGHEWADANVDVYTHARLQWLAAHLSRAGYCDAAAEEMGADGDTGIADRIGLGQYEESREVYELVLSALRGRASAMTIVQTGLHYDRARDAFYCG